MPRPENIADIEVQNVEFATILVDQITLDPTLLKGYTAFLEAATKAGAITDSVYRGVRFLRQPTMAELEDQLRGAQSKWDNGKKLYDTLEAVGELEYSWEESVARQWAEGENLPFPPEFEPIKSFDTVIRDIDEVTV